MTLPPPMVSLFFEPEPCRSPGPPIGCPCRYCGATPAESCRPAVRNAFKALDAARAVLAAAPKQPWTCAARAQGTAGGNDPADCDWPGCGCDPYATRVIEALEEQGVLVRPTPAASGSEPPHLPRYEP
jgi:hypothetical protein